MPEKITIGRRGAITIPAKVRKAYGIQESDELLVESTPEGILLKPVVTVPIELYTEERIAEFMEENDAVARLYEQHRT